MWVSLVFFFFNKKRYNSCYFDNVGALGAFGD